MFKRIYDISLARNSCVNPARSDCSVSGTYGHPCCKELFLRQLLQSNYPFDGIATPEEMCFHVCELPSPVSHSLARARFPPSAMHNLHMAHIWPFARGQRGGYLARANVQKKKKKCQSNSALAAGFKKKKGKKVCVSGPTLARHTSVIPLVKCNDSLGVSFHHS